MALYDPQVRVFDAWEDGVFEDAAGWRTAVERWFGFWAKSEWSSASRNCAPPEAPMPSWPAPSSLLPGCPPLASRCMRCRIASAGDWPAARAWRNTSAPIDFQSGKAVLHRGLPIARGSSRPLRRIRHLFGRHLRRRGDSIACGDSHPSSRRRLFSRHPRRRGDSIRCPAPPRADSAVHLHAATSGVSCRLVFKAQDTVPKFVPNGVAENQNRSGIG